MAGIKVYDFSARGPLDERHNDRPPSIPVLFPLSHGRKRREAAARSKKTGAARSSALESLKSRGNHAPATNQSALIIHAGGKNVCAGSFISIRNPFLRRLAITGFSSVISGTRSHVPGREYSESMGRSRRVSMPRAAAPPFSSITFTGIFLP